MTSSTPAAAICLLLIASLYAADQAAAQDAAARDADAALQQARRTAVILSSSDAAVELIATPLLSYGEPTRGNEGGSLWAWGRSGRPLVISELFLRTGDEETWFQTLSLTSTELLTADTPAGRWAPQQQQLNMKPVASAPRPAEQQRRRLQQMRQLARRYNAHEFWDPGDTRYELRLLTSPLHRYDDAQAGIIDGAVFVFAHGTNPEILVFIEAQAAADGPRWQAGFAASGSAELHVTLDDQDVWETPRAINVTGRPSDPYWLIVTTAAALPEAGTSPRAAGEVSREAPAGTSPRAAGEVEP